MKPRKLRIKGLNSFVEEQEIDFERLTERGLFGIFGPTGSGKSTILDAITLALYGSISRDTNEYMNTLSDNLLVSYEFEIGLGEARKRYIADRVLSRDKTGKSKLKSSRLIEVTESENKPVAEGATEVKKNIETIVGLNCEDFTRSVVLPQGKFNEFLHLSGKDRRNMLERIFRLEKYGRGLADKIRAVKKQKSESLNILTGKINSYEEQGVSKEKFVQLKEEIKILAAKETELKKKIKDNEQKYEKYNQIWSMQNELNNYLLDEKEEEKKEPHINELKSKLQAAEKALTVKPYIVNLEETLEKIKSNLEALEFLEKEFSKISTEATKTEIDHTAWIQRKDEELPKLIELESKLNRAIELQRKIKILEGEKEVLSKKYLKVKSEKTVSDTKINEVNKCMDILKSEKESLEKRIEDIRVSPEYREMLQTAVTLESGVEDNKIELKKLQNRIDEININCEKINTRLEAAKINKDKSDLQIEDIIQKYEELIKNNPGDSSILIKKREDRIALDNEIKDMNAYIDKQKELNEKLEQLRQEKEKAETGKRDLNSKITEMNQKKAQIDVFIKNFEMDNMAAILAADLSEGKSCPVCGSEHHPSLAKHILVQAEDINLKINERETLEKAINEWDSELRKTEAELFSIMSSEKYFADELKSILEKFKEDSSEDLKGKALILEKEYDTLSKAINEWVAKKELMENQIRENKDLKADVEKSVIQFTEELKTQNTLLKDNSLSREKLLQKSTEINKKLEILKKELNLDSFKTHFDNIKAIDKEIAEKTLRLKEVIELIKTSDKEKEELTKIINNSEIELATIKESGLQKASVIESEKAELDKLSEGKNPEEYIKEVRGIKGLILENEQALRIKLEGLSKKKQELSDQIVSVKSVRESFSAQEKEEREKLKMAISQTEFKSIDEVQIAIISEEIMKSMNSEIKGYEDKIKTIKINIESLNLKLKGETIQKEAWNEIKTQRADFAEENDRTIREISKKTQQHQEIEKNLRELEEHFKARAELEHICSNIDDLAKLVEGNKFVEFVAISQLKYISMEASKRLKSITRERYALEIDASGNFIMRDDFNGGARRSTSTLSGGETFLTSLSLALALSSQIQLKGSAPLEFFFLDEGFGTLDSDLLETVMESLERLHSDKLCVGIISHVEELKSRVPIKLLVEPAEQGKNGSKVRIELS